MIQNNIIITFRDIVYVLPYLLKVLLNSRCIFIQAKRTDCNHIFLNFVPTMTLSDPSKLEEMVRSMVLRYGPRILKLRVLQAEIKMTIK